MTAIINSCGECAYCDLGAVLRIGDNQITCMYYKKHRVLVEISTKPDWCPLKDEMLLDENGNRSIFDDVDE